MHNVITSPVTEIKDFERVPENIVSWIYAAGTRLPPGFTRWKSYDFL